MLLEQIVSVLQREYSHSSSNSFIRDVTESLNRLAASNCISNVAQQLQTAAAELLVMDAASATEALQQLELQACVVTLMHSQSCSKLVPSYTQMCRRALSDALFVRAFKDEHRKTRQMQGSQQREEFLRLRNFLVRIQELALEIQANCVM